ncbi:MAG TPA: heavy-metal-associated domain-containing protein [Candidatus Limnocylindria bacterium]|nr:heavy-metal-associated domain-containing protein [Candidatus Limnocylindria bacterium]
MPVLLGASCVASGAAGAERTPAPPAPLAAIAPQAAELRIDIVELTCHSCAGAVALGTSRIPGVLKVSAEMLDHILIVRYDPTRLTEPALMGAIDKVVDSVVR